MSSAFCKQIATIPVGCPICPGSYPTYGAPGTPVLHIKNWTDPCGTGMDGYIRYVVSTGGPICGFSQPESTLPLDPLTFYMVASINNLTNSHDLICATGDLSVILFMANAVDASTSFCGVPMTSPFCGMGGPVTFELEMAVPP